MDNDTEDGFRISVNQGLTKPDLMAGIPKIAAVIIGIVGLNSLLILKTIWVLPFLVVAWILCGMAIKNDPDFFSVLKRHLNDDDYLEP